MKRLKLLGMMLALTAAMACVVIFGSPYAPVVEPVMEIEDVWAIEDARRESDEPLITALENHGVPLGYDEDENTFYCTLGMGHTDAWPDIHLTAPHANGVKIAFVDDYSYDWCADAIRDGYNYQLIAYTDTRYSYMDIVFTSLPIIMLESEDDIEPHEDTPVRIAMNWDGTTGMESNARAHKRGDSSLRQRPKHGIKVEFTRNENGTGHIQQDVPYLGMSDGLILLACAMDHQLIRDRICWDMFSGIVEEGEPFGAMKSHYVEVFVNQEYQGAYLMMKPYQYETEIAKLGKTAPAVDSYYRCVGRSTYEFDRPVMQDHRNIYYEQHYAPADMKPFDSLMPYLELIREPSNARYSEMVMQYLDVDSFVRYLLFMHACGLTDNDVNNLNIWAHWEKGHLKYYMNPWDLDLSWGLQDEENAEIMYAVELFDRMVALDCGGVVRERVKAIWQEMREKAFNMEYMEALMARYELELNESGAYYRDAMKWEKSSTYLDIYNIHSYASVRFEMMDRRIAALTDESKRDRYLRIDDYDVVDEGPLEEIMKQDAVIVNSVQ